MRARTARTMRQASEKEKRFMMGSVDTEDKDEQVG